MQVSVYSPIRSFILPSRSRQFSDAADVTSADWVLDIQRWTKVQHSSNLYSSLFWTNKYISVGVEDSRETQAGPGGENGRKGEFVFIDGWVGPIDSGGGDALWIELSRPQEQPVRKPLREGVWCLEETVGWLELSEGEGSMRPGSGEPWRARVWEQGWVPGRDLDYRRASVLGSLPQA